MKWQIEKVDYTLEKWCEAELSNVASSEIDGFDRQIVPDKACRKKKQKITKMNNTEEDEACLLKNVIKWKWEDREIGRNVKAKSRVSVKEIYSGT